VAPIGCGGDGQAEGLAEGMVGGGQLARMTQQAAIGLGVTLRVLSEREDDSAARVVANVRVGDHRSLDDLRTFAKDSDVVTWDHEHVPGEHIKALEEAGTVCRPGSAALLHAQDKRVMRERLSALGVPVPRFAPVASPADAEEFA
jgi:5-(carboxyamino)imidazole ribonucleotide synthase